MGKYDYLIVGSGLYGSTFAHQASASGKRCLVVDRRNQIGGNIRCERMEGIDVHQYGPHIFHTSDEKVWTFVNSITPFHKFVNSPLAVYKDRQFNLPFNMNTFHQMWGVTEPFEAEEIISRQREEAKATVVDSQNPSNLEEQALMLVGRDIYETLIKGYTEKQWGRKCSELPSFIIKRLPFRLTYDNNYFNDTFQGIPDGGYNLLIEGLLRGVDVRTGVDFLSERAELESMADKVVFTGCIDEYFDYCFGPLQYRSVCFETFIYDFPDFQSNAIVNYTSADVPWTRVIEHKHFDPERAANQPKTVVSREYSREWRQGMEPFYPINDAANSALYEKYKALAGTCDKVVFAGRLGSFRYSDMAPTVSEVLSIKSF